jgi:hypothetical protein
MFFFGRGFFIFFDKMTVSVPNTGATSTGRWVAGCAGARLGALIGPASANALPLSRSASQNGSAYLRAAVRLVHVRHNAPRAQCGPEFRQGVLCDEVQRCS